ncbi:MAG TPA: alpha/beta fold hydrolase [Streptosporangiales bacterium]
MLPSSAPPAHAASHGGPRGALLLTRRGFLGAAGGVVLAGAGGLGLVETGVVPGRGALHRALGLDGPDTPLPDTAGGTVVGGTFTSRARRGIKVGWQAAYPPGERDGARLPVVLALHGRGASHAFVFRDLGADRFLAQATGQGTPPFVVASVDGGDHSYWHERSDGDDPPRMLLDELLPVLERRGLRTHRFGLLGWSMGGYGSLLLAERHPGRVAAVAAVSPALWLRAEDSAPGAFDGPDDFRRNDVFARVHALRNTPLRVDCGDVDPFAGATRAFRARLDHRPAGGFATGGHNVQYWRRELPRALAFLGAALRR